MVDNSRPAPEIDQKVAAIALRQNGNVARRQLLPLGLSDNAIASRVAHGWLHPVHPGVYGVGRPPRTPVERAAAAVHACGPHAALSHGSALALWGIWKRWPRAFDVTITAGRRRPQGIAVHRASTLTPRDIRTQLGVRVTSPARTLLDCAPTLTDRGLARAVNDARLARLLSPGQLADILARCPHQKGARRLAPFAETAAAGAPTRSAWEDEFPAFCAAHGLPKPRLNASVCGFEVDALFEAEKVIVELDSWEHHQSRTAFRTDRERDSTALAAGFVTVRLTWERFAGDRPAEAARLQRILADRRPPPA